jgi:hypothetical protein
VDLVLAAANNATAISSQLKELQQETLQMYRAAMVSVTQMAAAWGASCNAWEVLMLLP